MCQVDLGLPKRQEKNGSAILCAGSWCAASQEMAGLSVSWGLSSLTPPSQAQNFDTIW